MNVDDAPKKRGGPLKQAKDEYAEVQKKLGDPGFRDLTAEERVAIYARLNFLSRRIYYLTPRNLPDRRFK